MLLPHFFFLFPGLQPGVFFKYSKFQNGLSGRLRIGSDSGSGLCLQKSDAGLEADR